MSTRLYLDTAPIRLQPAQGEAITLQLSLEQLLAAGLGHFPPTELALEQAIATTEDALMAQMPALRAQPLELLQLADQTLAELPAVLGQPAGAPLTVEAVERAFNQLVAVAAGLPARSLGIPEQPQFVAALLVVRELMHHVGWKELQLP
jgi:hypothetical protein